MAGEETAFPEEDSEGRNERRVETLARVICPYSRLLAVMFSVLFVFTLLSVASVLALTPENPTYVIAVITSIMDGGLLVVIVLLLYLCRLYNLRRL